MTASLRAAPFLLLGDARRRELIKRASACVDRWRREWMGARSTMELREIDGSQLVKEWRDAICFVSGGREEDRLPANTYAFPGTSQASQQAPLALLMPVRGLPGMGYLDNERSLAGRLLSEALQALADELLSGAGARKAALERSAAPTDQLIRELSGQRYIGLRAINTDGRPVLALLFAPATVGALLPSPATSHGAERIERRVAAAGMQMVEIDAVLGHADVSVPDIASLAVGDVLVLNESLSELGQIVIRGGGVIAAAAPGRVDAKCAVQIKVERRKG